jgi:uncharacterized RDD family membrane protein YckC
MKCPKCHYLSFDPEPRCRNCGFSLALEEADLPSLVVADSPTRDALTEFQLPTRPQDSAPPTAPPDETDKAGDARDAPAIGRASMGPPPERVDHARHGASADTLASRSTVPARTQRPTATTELPLFVKNMSVDEAPPMDLPVTMPEPAVTSRRRPVAPSVEVKKVEPTKLGPLDDDLKDGLNRLDRRERVKPAVVRDLSDQAGRGQRLAAALVDALLVAALASAVVAMTLRWAGLGVTDWLALPRLPIGAFLLMITLGYLLMFTSLGGQTIGKMLIGIRVVDAGETGAEASALGPGQALYREVIAVPATLALGLGFLPALFGDGLAVHDRLAATRVIRA